MPIDLHSVLVQQGLAVIFPYVFCPSTDIGTPNNFLTRPCNKRRGFVMMRCLSLECLLLIDMQITVYASYEQNTQVDIFEMAFAILCMQFRSNHVLLISRKLYRYSKYLGSVLTRDSYCTREIKMRIVIAKEAFNRNISVLTSKLNIELRKKIG